MGGKQYINLSKALVLFLMPIAFYGCAKADEKTNSKSTDNSVTLKYDYSVLSLSDESIKLVPIDGVPFKDLPLDGMIKSKRPKNISTGFAPLASAAAAAADCSGFTPMAIHPGNSHSNGFITIPRVNHPAFRDNNLDLEIVKCIQERIEYDFIASIIPDYESPGPFNESKLEWKLDLESGDIKPFRSLHAKKN